MTDWTDQDNDNQDDLPPWERPRKRLNTNHPMLLLAVLVAGVFLVWALFFQGKTPDKKQTTVAATAQPPDAAAIKAASDRLVKITGRMDPAEMATADMGQVSGPVGSQAQANGLLNLMDYAPGKSLYVVMYQYGGEESHLAYLVRTEELVRSHGRPGGHGSFELWQGDIEYRLESAANGGSLNDTPAGKRPGGFLSF